MIESEVIIFFREAPKAPMEEKQAICIYHQNKNRYNILMCWTYILQCADGTYYCGWTNDLEKRLEVHNAGKGAKYTKSRRPVRLVYQEKFETKEAAMSREWHIKQMTRAQKEALIMGE